MFAGINNKPVSLILMDNRVLDEKMMEDIHNLLNSGDLSFLYIEKDYEDIRQACKSECIRNKQPLTKMNLYI